MAVCSVVASSQRMGPPHRQQVSTSARYTCRRSQPHRDLREAGKVDAVPSPELKWRPHHVAAKPLELFSVAPVDELLGVEVDAERLGHGLVGSYIVR